MNDRPSKLNPELPLQVVWPDSELGRIDFSDDGVNVGILESSGAKVEILCRSFLGVEYLGDGNDSVIESGSLDDTGDFLGRCLAQAAKRQDRRIAPCEQPMQLTIRFCDQTRLVIVANEFVVDRVE